ncbi:hypothetical protein AL522_22985 [Pantoea vagans]|nr:hypothetical protein AL522_22985 [Pantoea vagans]
MQGTGSEEESVPPSGENAGSVFEQREALAGQRAHLRDEVRNCAGRACHGWRILRLSDLTLFPAQARSQPRNEPACVINLNGPLNRPAFN